MQADLGVRSPGRAKCGEGKARDPATAQGNAGSGIIPAAGLDETALRIELIPTGDCYNEGASAPIARGVHHVI